MTSLDIYADDYPHGTRVGFAGGCKTKAMCANHNTDAQTCKEANMRYGRDWPYDELIKAGLTELEADAKLRANETAEKVAPAQPRKPRAVPKPSFSKAQLAATAKPVPDVDEETGAVVEPEPVVEPAPEPEVEVEAAPEVETEVEAALETPTVDEGAVLRREIAQLEDALAGSERAREAHLGSIRDLERTNAQLQAKYDIARVRQNSLVPAAMTPESLSEAIASAAHAPLTGGTLRSATPDALLTIDPTDAGGVKVAFNGVGARDVSITLVFAEHGLQDVDVKVGA